MGRNHEAARGLQVSKWHTNRAFIVECSVEFGIQNPLLPHSGPTQFTQGLDSEAAHPGRERMRMRVWFLLLANWDRSPRPRSSRLIAVTAYRFVSRSRALLGSKIVRGNLEWIVGMARMPWRRTLHLLHRSMTAPARPAAPFSVCAEFVGGNWVWAWCEVKGDFCWVLVGCGEFLFSFRVLRRGMMVFYFGFFISIFYFIFFLDFRNFWVVCAAGLFDTFALV